MATHENKLIKDVKRAAEDLTSNSSYILWNNAI